MAEEREIRVSTHSYISMICLSLFFSFLVYLSVVPSTPKQNNRTERYKVFYVIAQIIVVLIIGIVLFWFSFTRPKYHRKQTVFWPKQCRHCAQVLSMLTRWDGEPSQVLARSLTPSARRSSSSSRQVSSREGLEYKNDTSCPGTLWYLRRRSLAQAMIILGAIGILGVPLKIVNSILHQHATLLHVCRDIYVIVLISFVLPGTMLCIARYHDAVFVDTPLFSAGFAFLCGGFMWLATFKLFFPSGDLFGNASFPCWQNCTSGRFIETSLGASLMSMYAQCAIIGTVFLWTIWSSMIRQHTLHLLESSPEIQSFDSSRSRRRITSTWTDNNQNATRYDEAEPSDSCERNALLNDANCDRHRLPKSYLRRVFTVSLGAALLYSVARFGLAALPDTVFSTNAEFYLGTLLHSLFYLPVIVMCLHQQRLARVSRRFKQCHHPSCVGTALGVDDVVYLISLFGTFTYRIFNILSKIALIALDKSVKNAISLVYEFFLVYIAWLISSFLHRVQRQDFPYVNEVKWTVASLMYLGFVSASQWIKDSWDERYDNDFFDPEVSRIVYFLLQPLVLMFRLMTSLIAYETYHIVLSKYREITLGHTPTYGTIHCSQ